MKQEVAHKIVRELRELPSTSVDETEWEESRWKANGVVTLGKILFHQKDLLFSIDRFPPGGESFPHMHPMKQVRYVVSGEFIVNGKAYGPGKLIEFPEFTAYHVKSPKGGDWIVVQYPGSTGVGPTSRTGTEYNDLEIGGEIVGAKIA